MTKKQKKANFRNVLGANLSAIRDLQKIDEKRFLQKVSLIKKTLEAGGKIITSGVGKSSYLAMKMSATLSSLGICSFFVHPTEALHGDSGMVQEGDILLAYSYSGESQEVLKFAKYEKEKKHVFLVAITKNNQSSLGKLSDVVFPVKIQEEGSPLNTAPMASLTASLIMGDMLASELVDENFSEEKFSSFHPGGLLGLKFVKVKERMLKENLPIINLDNLSNHHNNFLQAVQVIDSHKKGIVGLINQRHNLLGVLTDGDIRRILLKNQGSNWHTLDVKKLMTHNPKTISEDDSLWQALNQMETNKITNLFVLNSKKQVVGILHIHDILDKNL